MGIDVEQVEKEANEIAYILDGIRNNPLVNAHEFAERLESKESLEKAFGISDIHIINYGADRRKYNKFCLAYLIKIFINFTDDDDDAEILLVGYKCIDWGDNYNGTVPENWENYWEHAHQYNKWLKGKKRSSKDHLGREAENKIIKALSKVLASIKLNSTDGKLGYIDKVLKDFENIPEKLTLPIPEWLRDNEQTIKIDGGESLLARFQFPNGGIVELFDGFQTKEVVEGIERIAKIVATAAPIIAVIVISGLLGRQIYNHDSYDSQKEAGFTVSAQLREDTVKGRKPKIDGETSKFKPLPPNDKTYDEE